MRTFCQVTAVVVRLDEALRVIGVDVEGVQVRADALDWGEVLPATVSVHSPRWILSCNEGCRLHLSHSSACLQHLALGGALIARHVLLCVCHGN